MLSFLYLVVLALLIAIYVTLIFFLKDFKNVMITNIVFVSLIVTCYLLVVIIAYIQNGPNDWNFLNTLPTANVSPFMFATLPIFFLLPKRIRKYHALLISLLSVGMFLSPTIGCIHNFAIGYKFHGQFVLNYVSHFALSLWGIYLIHSRQTELNIKNALISGSIIVTVAIIMMIINVIADTTFFGLSLNGKHSIYNQRIVENSFVSALLYFLGLIVVLIAGFFYQKLILFLKSKKEA